MRMAKTDQAARMHSSCCQNTSAQFYLGTHVYARIFKCHWTMRCLNGAYIDRLLDNHVVISDSRNCTKFTGLQLFSAFVRVLRTAFRRIVQNMFAQPYQNDTVRIRQCSGISAEKSREKRYCLPCAYNKYQNQTAQQIK